LKEEIPAGVSRREFIPPVVLLLIGLIHGLLYVFIIPPWQHYDEPTQFEYAWLIANRRGLPELGEFDQGMRREVAASMIEHDFFISLGYLPNLLSQAEPVWIGISQTGDRPLYYWLVSLPLWLVKGSDITFQLYLGRFVSLLLYLATILSAYGILAELTPRGHFLRWLAPLTLALLPGYTDLMTAINNDVGATAFFSLFLWASIVLLQRGFSWPVLGASLVLALACFWTKSTVIFAFMLIPILLLANLPRKFMRLAWGFLLATLVIGSLLLFRRYEAALWYRKGAQDQPLRTSQVHAPLGAHALELVKEPGTPSVQAYQLLPQAEIQKLRGKTVSLGMWIWASQPARVRAPGLYDGKKPEPTQIEVGVQPVFYATTINLDMHADKLKLILFSSSTAEGNPVSVYYDGLVLVRGKKPLDSAPVFANSDGREGQWGGRHFTNLIRNASAERGWFRIRPRIEKAFNAYYPINSSEYFNILIDWPGAGWYYYETSKVLLETFWGKFGWAHVAIASNSTYKLLAFVTLAGFLGAAVALIRRWRSVPKAGLLLMAVAFLALWGITFFRGSSSLSSRVFIPPARYAYPAIIPTALLLTTGWLELMRPLRRWKPAGQALPVISFLVFFLALDVLSIWSILQFYQ
jgi:hypothetical protein